MFRGAEESRLFKAIRKVRTVLSFKLWEKKKKKLGTPKGVIRELIPDHLTIRVSVRVV